MAELLPRRGNADRRAPTHRSSLARNRPAGRTRGLNEVLEALEAAGLEVTEVRIGVDRSVMKVVTPVGVTTVAVE